MTPRPRSSAPATLPLFVAPELRKLETERDRLAAVLKKMRTERRHGAILKTEFRLQRVTGQILALAQGKHISGVGA